MGRMGCAPRMDRASSHLGNKDCALDIHVRSNITVDAGTLMGDNCHHGSNRTSAEQGLQPSNQRRAPCRKSKRETGKQRSLKKRKSRRLPQRLARRHRGGSRVSAPAKRNDKPVWPAARRSPRGQGRHKKDVCRIGTLRIFTSRSRQGAGLSRYPKQQRTAGVLRFGLATKGATACGY